MNCIFPTLLITSIISFIGNNNSSAQNIAITDDNAYVAESSAILDVKSTSKGFVNSTCYLFSTNKYFINSNRIICF